MKLPYSLLSEHSQQWLFIFCGYGQDREVYNPLVQLLAPRYSVLFIDLPYHAYTTGISKKDFHDFMKELFNKYSITTFSSLSYSMGSRFNLILAEQFADRIQKMILIAPDGIRVSLWNRLATSTYLGHKLFRFYVQHENAYHRTITLLYQLRLLSKSLYAFSKWHMRDVTNRKKVYHAWMNMRLMTPDLNLIAIRHQQHPFDMIAYFGTQDMVIDTRSSEKLRAHFPLAQIHSVDKGHNLTDETLFAKIVTNCFRANTNR